MPIAHSSHWAVRCERCRKPIPLPEKLLESHDGDADASAAHPEERFPLSATLRCGSCQRERVYVRASFFELELAAHAAAG